jgi:pimeloyl-ACP methyl ester carboxylesterase
MLQLEQVLQSRAPWTIVGSSFGGLMGALYTCSHPDRVRKLVMLAPALIWPDFASRPPGPVDVPTIVYHGRKDSLIPLETTWRLAEQVFSHLTFHIVDDDHGLHQTAASLDWREVLA